jgi:2-polyprenyl-6-hydroxyphenyl methylase/3-demethylubiquinone-9 3-methyltransferase
LGWIDTVFDPGHQVFKERRVSANNAGTTGNNFSGQAASARPASSPGAADPAEIDKFDAIAHRFWDPKGEFRPLHVLNPVRSAWIASACELAEAHGLDVGCGGGLMCESLTALGARMVGIDLAPAMLETARLHAAEHGLAIDYRLLAAEELARQAPASFDVVTCLEMIEHVPDPQPIVAALSALVRPGGHVFISTLNRNPRSFLGAIVAAEHVLRLVPRGTHEYERLVRPSELARWAREAGLDLAGLTGIAYDPFAHTARLSTDLSVNYIAHFTRAADR